MRIVCIVGSWDTSPPDCIFWGHFDKAFQQEWPDCDIHRVRHPYHPWQKTKIQAIARHVLSAFDDGQPTLFIGHSIGGVVAQWAAGQMQHTPVLGVISVCGPLSVARLWGLHAKNPKVKTHSVMGWFDPIVPFWLGYLPGRTSILPMDHFFCFLQNHPGTAMKVVKAARQHLGL